ncbi:MAG: thiamine phosphate synthase [Deltaproteobacteria bacterium]|nr:thiamine phosphate synthase [Deltaproteobacteria bacterium]
MGNRGEKIDFNLYLITDRKQAHGRDLLDVIEDALKGGVKAVQLREKYLSGRELFELAKDLRAITKIYKAKLFINDRVDIAIAVNADGVHLGQTSFSVVDARKLLGSKKLIGVSTHSMQEALKAEKQGADFITLGPVFYTESKARYGKPLGIEKLKEAVNAVHIPVFAIGGMKLKNIKEVMAAGVNGVAMISEVIKAKNPKVMVRNLLEEIQ